MKRSAKNPNGLAAYCRPCSREVNQTWHERNRERRRQTKSEWRKQNRAKLAAQKRDYYKRHPEMAKRKSHRAAVRHHGITLRQWDEMLIAQCGRCAICEGPMTDPCVDHDHACCDGEASNCGKCVRGLLCRRCNSILGYAGDVPNVLTAAIHYLRIHEAKRVV